MLEKVASFCDKPLLLSTKCAIMEGKKNSPSVLVAQEEQKMAISYNKLWKLLIDKEMSRTQMRLKAGISTKALAKLGKNESVNIDILIKICGALDCDITDIMEIVSTTNSCNSKE